MKNAEENLILNKSFDFACEIIDIYALLIDKKMYRIVDQVCGSGTSIGANVHEAQRAVSKADFINKLGIALKEAEETEYWFRIIEKKIFSIPPQLKEELKSILKLLTTIILSAKSKP